MVGTNLETVRLIELLDESQNFLARGHLFVVPSPARDADDNHANDYKGKSHVVMLPLWADRDLRTSLLIKVFCGLDKLLFRRLDVPMFSMFTPWPEEINASSGQPDDHRNRLSYALSSRSDVFQVSNPGNRASCKHNNDLLTAPWRLSSGYAITSFAFISDSCSMVLAAILTTLLPVEQLNQSGIRMIRARVTFN